MIFLGLGLCKIQLIIVLTIWPNPKLLAFIRLQCRPLGLPTSCILKQTEYCAFFFTVILPFRLSIRTNDYPLLRPLSLDVN